MNVIPNLIPISIDDVLIIDSAINELSDGISSSICDRVLDPSDSQSQDLKNVSQKSSGQSTNGKFN